MRVGKTGVVALVATLIAIPCFAQGGASLAINAGTATDLAGVGSTAVTIAPSFTRASGYSSVTLGASATKFANEAWSASLSTALSRRTSSRLFSPAIDLVLNAATTSYDYSYASADVIPTLELKSGGMKAFAGARLAAAGANATIVGPVGPIPTGSRTMTSSRTAATGIGGLRFEKVTSAGEVASIGYRGEAGQVAGATQTDHALNAAVANSRLMVGGAVGRRGRAGTAVTHGSATVGVAVSARAMLLVAAGNYPSNGMLGTAAGRFVNAGLSMRLGRTSGSMPRPSNVDGPATGRTRVSILAADARRVELAGDFTKWKPVAATRAHNGVWYVDLELPPGEYRYAFRINGKEWRVPEGVAAADDEFGGKSAWLKVSGSK